MTDHLSGTLAFWARGLVPVLAGLAALPAAAQQTPTWRTIAEDEKCWLELVDADESSMVLMSVQSGDIYRVSSILTHGPAEDGAIPILTARFAGGDVLLMGTAEMIGAQATGKPNGHPVALFIEAAGGADEFVLDDGSEQRTLPLTGFEEAGRAMGECARRVSTPNAAGGIEPAGSLAREARLVSFDGVQQLGAEASRQRLLSENIGYTFTIDARGGVTDCRLSRDFRRRAVTIALCRPFQKHAIFEPALDAAGNPVEGTFSIEVDFDMWMSQQGYLEAEDR